MKELAVKFVIYCVLAIVAAFVALEMADCSDVVRIIYDKGNSEAGQHARFYFLTLMGLGVIIVQNSFIRWAIDAQDRKAPEPEVK
jgi:hypothetical protein